MLDHETDLARKLMIRRRASARLPSQPLLQLHVSQCRTSLRTNGAAATGNVKDIVCYTFFPHRPNESGPCERQPPASNANCQLVEESSRQRLGSEDGE